MKPAIGGQAVIEGVMMRSPNYYCAFVRDPTGKLKSILRRIQKKKKWLTWPFVRGVVNLVEMLFIGTKTLTWSANQQADTKEEKLSDFHITLTIAVAMLFGLGLFVALPYFLSMLTGLQEESSPVAFNLVDGIIKLAIFFLYVYLISFMKDVKRLFQYHGAEHQAVHCYEANKKLIFNNTQKFSTKHERCGTSFLFLVIVVSALVFTFIPVIIQVLFPNFISLNLIARKAILFTVRISFIPIVAAISYELLRLAGKYTQNPLLRLISYPGLLFQKITTSKPDKKQTEVAIKALEKLVEKENKLQKKKK